MKDIIPERPENYECTIAGDESRKRVLEEMRTITYRWDFKGKEYKKAGFDVFYTINKREGKRETDYFFLKGPTGYSVQDGNGKTLITARTRDDLAKEAYIRGIVGYYTRVEIGQGKAAAERAKKDPAVRERVIKIAGKAANLY